MIKRLLLYLIVMFILLAVAMMAGRQEDNDALLETYSRSISSWLSSQAAEAKNWSGADQAGATQANKPYTVLIHRSDSLLSYSNTQIIPTGRDLKRLAVKTGASAVQLPLGWFLAQVSPNGSAVKTTLVPIRYALNFDGTANKSLFPADRAISPNLQISNTQTAWPIIVDGREIAWLNADGPLQSGWMTWLRFGAWLLFFVTFFSLLNQAARWISERMGALAGASVLMIVIGALLYVNHTFGWAGREFAGIGLFDRHFEGAALIGNSVGDWLMHASMLVFVMVFFHRNYQQRTLENLPSGMRLGIATLSATLTLAAIPMCILVARQLVFNSLIGFDFDHILGIGQYGFLALSGMIIFMVGLFLFGHRLLTTVRHLELTRNQRYGVIAVATVLMTLVGLSLDINALYLGIFSLLYLLAMDTFVHWEGSGFGWVVVWVLLFSLFSSTLLYQYNYRNDRDLRQAYAVALASERDTASTEKLLPLYLSAIRQDSANISQILKPWPFKAELEELRAHLNTIALQEDYLFQHYKLKVAAFDQEHQPVLMGQTLNYQEVAVQTWNAAQTFSSDNDLRYFSGSDGKFSYLLRFNATRATDNSQQVQIFVVLEHEHLAPNRAYTQIFYNRPYKNLNRLAKYTFAVQKDGRILAEQGRASLAALATNLNNGQVIELENDAAGRVDAVAKSADGETIAAVGHASGGWLKQVYLFSIIFTLTSLLLLALAFANSLFSFLPEAYDFRLTAKGSLARRIHLWNVSLLAVSFLVIGFLTYRHFMSAAGEADRADFNYQTETLQNSLEAPLFSQQDSNSQTSSNRLVKSFAEMTASLGADANLYAPDGELLFSTHRDFIGMGILPTKMNVGVRNTLTSSNLPELEVTEQVAGYTFSTKYRPCRDGRGELLGFIGAPHPINLGKIGADVSDFIGILASLYVFLLLIAFAVTYVLSRSIIKPLSLLSEKVQELKFTDKNAPLEYAGDNQDEISELIGQYNTMVAKLEDSKVQLVRLEREGAWREMARQVAHDIKNPLTTMKLSMQQLERVSSNPEQAAAYLRKAITRLIEQIDSLAQIASEFSMFANLDIRHKNDVVINEVVESVHDLFSEQKNVKLELSLPKDQFHILGDKNHLIRVFNNLVINAIQAIPSDRDGSIQVSLTKVGNESVVRISDNGGGIPPEIRDRVFEPNFTTKTSGSGLGLAICKKIIEAHDGNIRFETRENEGTDFFVEIPVVER